MSSRKLRECALGILSTFYLFFFFFFHLSSSHLGEEAGALSVLISLLTSPFISSWRTGFHSLSSFQTAVVFLFSHHGLLSILPLSGEGHCFGIRSQSVYIYVLVDCIDTLPPSRSVVGSSPSISTCNSGDVSAIRYLASGTREEDTATSSTRLPAPAHRFGSPAPLISEEWPHNCLFSIISLQ